MKKKILVIDDEQNAHDHLDKEIGEKYELLHAYTAEEAQKGLETDPNTDAIIFDGYLEEGNTLGLISWLSGKFSGPMIAASTSSSMRREQIEAGCTHEIIKSDINNQKLSEVI